MKYSVRKNALLVLVALFLLLLASAGIVKVVSLAADGGNIKLSADIAEEYARNATFVIPEGELQTNAGNKQLDSKLIFPSGDIFSGKTAYLSEVGEYQLLYSDENGYSKNYTFEVVNKMSGLFSYGSGISAKNDASIPEYMPNFDGEIKKGVEFTMEVGGTNYITYNKVLDLNKCNFSKFAAQDNSTSFVEFLFTPEEQGTKEINCFQVILTDIYDPTNYLTIEMLAGDIQSIYPEVFYAKASPKNLYRPIGLMSGFETYGAGRSISVPMNGQENTELGKNYSAKLFFDVNNTELWGGGVYYRRVEGVNPDGSLIVGEGVDNEKIMDAFDNPDVVGLNNVWNGFTTGEVYLSFRVKDYALSKASFTVLSIGGKTFADNYVEIGEINYIPKTNQFDLNTDYLVAGEGYSYKPFDMIVTSENYGILDDVSVAVYYGEDKARLLPIQDGRFAVKNAGKYILEYTAKSPLGKHVHEIVLTAKSAYEAKDILTYAKSDKIVKTAKYGETVYLFDGVGAGGIGATKVSYEVICNDKAVSIDYSSKTPKFKIDEMSDYKVKITYSDEIGGKVVVEHIINTSYDSIPRFEIPVLPDVYVSGSTYFFQTPEAYYWGENGNELVNMEVLVNNVDVSNGYKVTGDFTLTYKASLQNNKNIVNEQSISCKAITVTEGENYFTSYFTQNGATLISEEEGLSFKTDSNENKLKFNRVIKDDLLSTTLFVDGSMSNFEGVEIILTDARNSNQKYVCSFRNMFVAGKTYVGFFDGSQFVTFVDTAFDGTSANPFGIIYDKKNFTLSGYLNDSYGKMRYYTNGEKFEGFESGYVFVEYRIFGVNADSEVLIKGISNQVFKSTITTDKIQPQVIYSESLSTSSIGVFGKVFTAPSAISFDVLSDVTACSLKVYKPGSTNPLYDGEAIGYEFKLDTMGNYRLVYECKDGKNNSYKFTYYILCVEDVKPTIKLDNIITKTDVNTVYRLASATMTDNVKVTASCKYILDNYRAILVDGDTYTFTRKGIYTIVYYAVDDCNNYAMVSYKVEVK